MKVLLVSVILVAIGVPSWCQEKTTSVASYRADGAMKLASTTQVSRASFMMRSAADTSQPKKDMTTQSSSQKNPDLACKDGGYPAITMIFSR
ncbi:hypothetical protein BIW11_08718 [Tropilaelaps mercedesae]|uniref:Uncharacterized protein n=1 Tax=Tropilaelaps mercedesae TaxID=418985 RepID=A0A1V9XNA5_9ACAR|nr:hypothetical protein BIW11_08718 [Tropilaelaps mercedesae]